jgi:hypothetical protein
MPLAPARASEPEQHGGFADVTPASAMASSRWRPQSKVGSRLRRASGGGGFADSRAWIRRRHRSPASSESNRVEIDDGRRFTNKTNALWDWVRLDAYLRKSQIPPHVATVEFFEVARNRLTPDGLFVVNLTGSKEFLRRVSITMQVVFPGSTFWSVDSGRNEVAASSRQAGLIQRPQAAAQPRLEADLIKFGVDLPSRFCATLCASRRESFISLSETKRFARGTLSLWNH